MSDEDQGAPSEGEFTVIPPNGRTCATSGCENPVPDGSHPARKYCDEHFVGGGGAGKKRAREQAPKLVLELGGSKAKGGAKEVRARETAAGATAFMNVAAAGAAVFAGGDPTSPFMRDAVAIKSGAQAWGDAMGELSKYQPWISSFFAPVGGDSQMKALFAVALATGAIVLPVMANHGVLPDSVGAMMGGMFVATADSAGAHQADAANVA